VSILEGGDDVTFAVIDDHLEELHGDGQGDRPRDWLRRCGEDLGATRWTASRSSTGALPRESVLHIVRSAAGALRTSRASAHDPQRVPRALAAACRAAGVAPEAFDAAVEAEPELEQLRSAAISRAFDEQANLEGITRDPTVHLHVADVVHAATIDVDESGARAAAATGVVIDLPAPIPSITLNRPFLFWLRNVRTGVPIVMGRFMGGDG